MVSPRTLARPTRACCTHQILITRVPRLAHRDFDKMSKCIRSPCSGWSHQGSWPAGCDAVVFQDWLYQLPGSHRCNQRPCYLQGSVGIKGIQLPQQGKLHHVLLASIPCSCQGGVWQADVVDVHVATTPRNAHTLLKKHSAHYNSDNNKVTGQPRKSLLNDSSGRQRPLFQKYSLRSSRM